MSSFPRWILPTSLSLAVALGAAGCKSGGQGGINGDTTTQASDQGQNQYPANDPASANLAPVSNASDNTGAPPGESSNQSAQQSGTNNPPPQYSSNPPSPFSSSVPSQYSTPPPAQQSYQQYSAQQDPYASQYPQGSNYGNYNGYSTPVEYAPEPPPELPQYQQPPVPGDNYVWTPGYWNYQGGQGYYWVPGAWTMAPYMGALWTPGWWGADGGRYGWHRGYWGRHIGYYGGIDYGHGYTGYGYQGGYWNGDHFAYNRAVNNINPSVVRTVYNYNITRITRNETRVSYNGGSHGIHAQPRPAEIEALHEQHNPPMNSQLQHARQALSFRQNFAKVDNGRPAVLVASNPLPADRNVRPPAPVRVVSSAQNQRSVPPPQPGHYANNVHAQPGGPQVRNLHGNQGQRQPMQQNQQQRREPPQREAQPNAPPQHTGPQPHPEHPRVNQPAPRRPEMPARHARPSHPAPTPAPAQPAEKHQRNRPDAGREKNQDKKPEDRTPQH